MAARKPLKRNIPVPKKIVQNPPLPNGRMNRLTRPSAIEIA
jgi:hypothetical protein